MKISGAFGGKKNYSPSCATVVQEKPIHTFSSEVNYWDFLYSEIHWKIWKKRLSFSILPHVSIFS